MSLVAHAKYELERAGLFDKDSDYEGMLGRAVLRMVEVFASEGHSGMSAHLALDIFNRVARFKTLTPLTNDPDEWVEVAVGVIGKPGVFQNRRDNSCFSNDGGKTYYSVDDKERSIKIAVPHAKS